MSDPRMWSTDRRDQLRALWAVKPQLSGAAIGLQMGITRCMVIGMARRMGLPDRKPTPAPPRPRAARPKRSSGQIKTDAATARNLARERIPLPAGLVWQPLPDREPVPITALEDHHCRWPLGEDRVTGFCGAARVSGSPYCLDHCATAWGR